MKLIAFLFTLGAISAFAQTESISPPTESTPSFESPGRVQARRFIPENLMKGPSHYIGPEAENDGLNNTYFLY